MVLDGKTKLIFGGVILATFIAMLIMGQMTPEQFQEQVLWLFGLFALGRGMEHIGKGIGKNGSAG